MPIKIIKGSFEYCTENKLFFIFVLLLFFLCNFLIDNSVSIILVPIIIQLIMVGYGLQVSQDIINGGIRLPKIMPKKVISLGIKGMIVILFYVEIQIFILALVSLNLNFPQFELEELILQYNETIHLFMTHDHISCLIFIISGFIVVYITSFFMEMALARLADGGSIKNAFNFPRIKHAIDVIGWKNYTWGYTKIIIAIVILTHLLNYRIPIQPIDTVVDSILSLLIFIIEFMGIGHVYKVYKENKLNNNIK